MGMWDLIFRRSKYKKPAKITLANMKGYIQGNWRALMDFANVIKPEQHILEQAKWRLMLISKNSPLCVKEKSCIHCGCSIAEKVYEDRGCEGNCYSEILDNKQWEDYKLNNNIIFEI